MREEIVPQVVLEAARCADDDAAHLIPEVAPKPRDEQHQAGVKRQFASGHARVQIIDGVLKYQRRHGEHRRAQHE
jgi:hypothetical protein